MVSCSNCLRTPLPIRSLTTAPSDSDWKEQSDNSIMTCFGGFLRARPAQTGLITYWLGGGGGGNESGDARCLSSAPGLIIKPKRGPWEYMVNYMLLLLLLRQCCVFISITSFSVWKDNALAPYSDTAAKATRVLMWITSGLPRPHSCAICVGILLNNFVLHVQRSYTEAIIVEGKPCWWVLFQVTLVVLIGTRCTKYMRLPLDAS